RGLEVVAGADEVVALGDEELESLALLLVLLDGEHVDGPEPFDVGGHGAELGAELLGVAFDQLDARRELGEGTPPFGLEALPYAAPGGLTLGARELEAMAFLGNCVAGAAKRARACMAGTTALRPTGELLMTRA